MFRLSRQGGCIYECVLANQVIPDHNCLRAGGRRRSGCGVYRAGIARKFFRRPCPRAQRTALRRQLWEQGVNKGTLYSIDPSLSAPPVVHVTFTGPNGDTPYDELIYDGASGRFYGATSRGGANNLGTIFAFDPSTNVLTTLKDDFDTSLWEPRGPFVVINGFIYGVIFRPYGGVFRMKTDGTGYKVIHNYADFNTLPQGVTLGGDGKLYGVTIGGGVVCNPSMPN